MDHYECGNLFRAGRSLLESSGLVGFRGDSFVCKGDEEAFEELWKESLDPHFGRYMLWVWFSVGAENLVKAALVCNGLVEGETQELGYPVFSDETDWGRMAIVDTKPFKLRVILHRIFVERPQVTGIPAWPGGAACYRRSRYIL